MLKRLVFAAMGVLLLVSPAYADEIQIPALGIHATLEPSVQQLVEYEGRLYYKWSVPDENVGWRGGPQIVLSGHTPGVFTGLREIEAGDLIHVELHGRSRTYAVSHKLFIQRYDSRSYTQLLQSTDDRLMIVTCHGSMRLIVIAYPEAGGGGT